MAIKDWEKIFTNPTFNRELISNIYKEYKELESQEPNNPTKKWWTELSKEFSTEEYKTTEKHLKKGWHPYSPGKCKSKRPWNSTSLQSELPRSKMKIALSLFLPLVHIVVAHLTVSVYYFLYRKFENREFNLYNYMRLINMLIF